MRRTAAALLVLLAAILPAVAVASWWAYGQATNTERFTDTAGPLAADRAVQREIADELVAAADRRLGDIPGGAEAARARVRSIADDLRDSPAYRASWRAAQRTLHARLVTRLHGGTETPLRLELGPLADVLRTQVRDAGLPAVADAIPNPQPVTIANRDELRRAREAADALRVIRAIAIPGAVLALLGVLLTAPRPAAGLVRVGLCLAVSALVLIAGRFVIGDVIADGDDENDIAVAIFDVLVRPLRSWVIGGLAGGLALAVVGLGLGGGAVESDR